MTRLPFTAVATALLVACGGPIALSDDKSDIEAACRTQVWISGDKCPCFAEKAVADLDDNQRAWLAASGGGDQAEVAHLEGEMSDEQKASLGLFVAMTPSQCP